MLEQCYSSLFLDCAIWALPSFAMANHCVVVRGELETLVVTFLNPCWRSNQWHALFLDCHGQRRLWSQERMCGLKWCISGHDDVERENNKAVDCQLSTFSNPIQTFLRIISDRSLSKARSRNNSISTLLSGWCWLGSTGLVLSVQTPGRIEGFAWSDPAYHSDLMWVQSTSWGSLLRFRNTP